jgi:hypothetical protein
VLHLLLKPNVTSRVDPVTLNNVDQEDKLAPVIAFNGRATRWVGEKNRPKCIFTLIFKRMFFSNTHNDNAYYISFENSTAILKT